MKAQELIEFLSKQAPVVGVRFSQDDHLSADHTPRERGLLKRFRKLRVEPGSESDNTFTLRIDVVTQWECAHCIISPHRQLGGASERIEKLYLDLKKMSEIAVAGRSVIAGDELGTKNPKVKGSDRACLYGWWEVESEDSWFRFKHSNEITFFA